MLQIPFYFIRECLKLIPHQKFSFAKIWLLAAQFEIRQLRLKEARLLLGEAIGRAPKDKVFPQTSLCGLILLLIFLRYSFACNLTYMCFFVL